MRRMEAMWRPVAFVAAAVMVLGLAACGLTAVQGYDYQTNKPAKLDDDSSVPYNWAGWKIGKVSMGRHEGGYGGTSTVHVTLTNRSKQDVTTNMKAFSSGQVSSGGALLLVGFKDGKKVDTFIKIPLCVPASKDSDTSVSEANSEVMKAGETRECLGEMYLANDDGSPSADTFRPWDLSIYGADCKGNNNKFDSCHRHLGTTQDIKVSR